MLLSSWECELRRRDEDTRHWDEQLQLTAADLATHEEALVTQEWHVEVEHSTILTREQNLNDWSQQLRDHEAQLQAQESWLQEDQAVLQVRAMEAANREAALILREQDLKSQKDRVSQ